MWQAGVLSMVGFPRGGADLLEAKPVDGSRALPVAGSPLRKGGLGGDAAINYF